MEAAVHIEDLKRIEAVATPGPWFTDTRLPLEILVTSPDGGYPWRLIGKVEKQAGVRTVHVDSNLLLILTLRNLAPDLLELWAAARGLPRPVAQSGDAQARQTQVSTVAQCARRLDERLAEMRQSV